MSSEAMFGLAAAVAVSASAKPTLAVLAAAPTMVIVLAEVITILLLAASKNAPTLVVVETGLIASTTCAVGSCVVPAAGSGPMSVPLIVRSPATVAVRSVMA